MATATLTCYRHPDRETGLRCQRCERGVCPDCLVPAPVGVQCLDCVRAARSRVISGRALLVGATPYATYVLVGLNVAAWVVGVGVALAFGAPGGILGGGGWLIRLAGLSGGRIAQGEWWRVFTSAFLHSGLLHLAFNMAALYLFGPPLERALGRWRFGGIYLVSLLAGSLGALIVSPGALTVGASGAIFGLLGAILAAQRAAGINLRSGGMIPLLVINLVFTIAVPGISIGGHLGGLAGGFIAGSLLFDKRLRERRAAISAALCLGLAVLLFGACLGVAAGHFGRPV